VAAVSGNPERVCPAEAGLFYVLIYEFIEENQY
jgi:hypothetical protein